MNDQPQTLRDWIPLCEAAQLVPSPRSGKRTHLSTIYRWINAGRLECRRNGRWRFVRRLDVLALLQPDRPRPRPATPPTASAVSRETQRILTQNGLI